MEDVNEVMSEGEEMAWGKVQREKLGMKAIADQAGAIRKGPELHPSSMRLLG